MMPLIVNLQLLFIIVHIEFSFSIQHPGILNRQKPFSFFFSQHFTLSNCFKFSSSCLHLQLRNITVQYILVPVHTFTSYVFLCFHLAPSILLFFRLVRYMRDNRFPSTTMEKWKNEGKKKQLFLENAYPIPLHFFHTSSIASIST